MMMRHSLFIISHNTSLITVRQSCRGASGSAWNCTFDWGFEILMPIPSIATEYMALRLSTVSADDGVNEKPGIVKPFIRAVPMITPLYSRRLLLLLVFSHLPTFFHLPQPDMQPFDTLVDSIRAEMVLQSNPCFFHALLGAFEHWLFILL